jgi:hypothetical protein
MLTKGSGSRKTLWVYPEWYKTSNEKGRDKPLQNSAKFAPLDSLAKLARETSLDGLDWGLAVLVAAEHAVEPCYLVHVGFGGSGGVLLQAADGGEALAEMLGIVGGFCDLRLVCIGLYCWLYDGDELAARDELCDRGRRGVEHTHLEVSAQICSSSSRARRISSGSGCGGCCGRASSVPYCGW